MFLKRPWTTCSTEELDPTGGHHYQNFCLWALGFFHFNKLLPSANPKVLNHCENSEEVLCCGAFLPVIQFESGRRGRHYGCLLGCNILVGRFCGVQASFTL